MLATLRVASAERRTSISAHVIQTSLQASRRQQIGHEGTGGWSLFPGKWGLSWELWRYGHGEIIGG
jgi:hypothetical protein